MARRRNPIPSTLALGVETASEEIVDSALYQEFASQIAEECFEDIEVAQKTIFAEAKPKTAIEKEACPVLLPAPIRPTPKQEAVRKHPRNVPRYSAMRG
jgi:hypothetical protein